MVKFAQFTSAEQQTVDAIVRRAVDGGIYDDALSVHMDISAVHARCPLRLSDLLDADQFDFLHDMYGIKRHLNRATGKLENFFLPRYAA